MSQLFVAVILFFFSILSTPVFAATMELKSSKDTNPDQTVVIEVLIDTLGEKTVGTDLLVKFIPADLEFIEARPGELYANYHQPRLDLNAGTIRYSGTINKDMPFSGSGVFATLVFKKLTRSQQVFPPEKSGKRPLVELVWKRDDTTDTNIVSVAGKELLFTAPTVRIGGKILGVAEIASEPTTDFLKIQKSSSLQLAPLGIGVGIILLITLLLLFPFLKKRLKKIPVTPEKDSVHL